MHILLVGLNHKTAPLEVRERLAFPREQMEKALPVLQESLGEGAILSTCNRTEVYGVTDDLEGAGGQVMSFLESHSGSPAGTVSPYLYHRADADAARHLFRVASGLDSMIVGETQILGQVRDSLAAASSANTVQVPLVGLFHAAVRTGRRAREETDVGRNALSMSYAGVQLAERLLGSLRGLRVLLIGAGEAGQLVARALRTAGVADLALVNRTLARGEELARSLGGSVVPFSDIGLVLSESDIVISATDASDFVIGRDEIASAARGRKRDLFIFDLAMPRDIDPDAGELEGVRLFNIDDLSAIAEENLEERKRAAKDAEAIVEQELSRFMGWWDTLEAAPVVKNLRQQAEDIRQRELAKALRRLRHLDADDREVVDALSQSIVNALLHEPTAFLKQKADKSQVETVKDLFRLWDGGDD
ncbi:MAG: glutamyl-tRNA reductase [Chloroflexi bacterium]|nr:glutamyl-tRNA reductase [Chloroflexota bacterium]